MSHRLTGLNVEFEAPTGHRSIGLKSELHYISRWLEYSARMSSSTVSPFATPVLRAVQTIEYLNIVSSASPGAF